MDKAIKKEKKVIEKGMDHLMKMDKKNDKKHEKMGMKKGMSKKRLLKNPVFLNT